MENNTAKYKFNTNLLKASQSINLEDAKKEWKIIYEEKREENDGLCICQRKVKNIIYMYNIKTQNTIIVGTVCCKKFEMNKDKLSNTILYNLLKTNLIKGEYTNINNIVTYCNSVNEQLIQHIQEEFETIINNYNQSKEGLNKNLTELLNIIIDLIQQYNLEYLQDIYIIIKNKLNENENKNWEEIKNPIEIKNLKSGNYYIRKYLRKNYSFSSCNCFNSIKKLCSIDHPKDCYFQLCFQHKFSTFDDCMNMLSFLEKNIEYEKITKIEIILNNTIIKTIITQYYY